MKQTILPDDYPLASVTRFDNINLRIICLIDERDKIRRNRTIINEFEINEEFGESNERDSTHDIEQFEFYIVAFDEKRPSQENPKVNAYKTRSHF